MTDVPKRLRKRDGLVRADLRISGLKEAQQGAISMEPSEITINLADGKILNEPEVEFKLLDSSVFPEGRALDLKVIIPRSIRAKTSVKSSTHKLNVDVGLIKISGTVSAPKAEAKAYGRTVKSKLKASALPGTLLAQAANEIEMGGVASATVELVRVDENNIVQEIYDSTTTDSASGFEGLGLPEDPSILTQIRVINQADPTRPLMAPVLDDVVTVDTNSTWATERIMNSDLDLDLENLDVQEAETIIETVETINPETISRTREETFEQLTDAAAPVIDNTLILLCGNDGSEGVTIPDLENTAGSYLKTRWIYGTGSEVPKVLFGADSGNVSQGNQGMFTAFMEYGSVHMSPPDNGILTVTEQMQIESLSKFVKLDNSSGDDDFWEEHEAYDVPKLNDEDFRDGTSDSSNQGSSDETIHMSSECSSYETMDECREFFTDFDPYGNEGHLASETQLVFIDDTVNNPVVIDPGIEFEEPAAEEESTIEEEPTLPVEEPVAEEPAVVPEPVIVAEPDPVALKLRNKYRRFLLLSEESTTTEETAPAEETTSTVSEPEEELEEELEEESEEETVATNPIEEPETPPDYFQDYTEEDNEFFVENNLYSCDPANGALFDPSRCLDSQGRFIVPVCAQGTPEFNLESCNAITAGATDTNYGYSSGSNHGNGIPGDGEYADPDDYDFEYDDNFEDPYVRKSDYLLFAQTQKHQGPAQEKLVATKDRSIMVTRPTVESFENWPGSNQMIYKQEPSIEEFFPVGVDPEKANVYIGAVTIDSQVYHAETLAEFSKSLEVGYSVLVKQAGNETTMDSLNANIYGMVGTGMSYNAIMGETRALGFRGLMLTTDGTMIVNFDNEEVCRKSTGETTYTTTVSKAQEIGSATYSIKNGLLSVKIDNEDGVPPQVFRGYAGNRGDFLSFISGGEDTYGPGRGSSSFAVREQIMAVRLYDAERDEGPKPSESIIGKNYKVISSITQIPDSGISRVYNFAPGASVRVNEDGTLSFSDLIRVVGHTNSGTSPLVRLKEGVPDMSVTYQLLDESILSFNQGDLHAKGFVSADGSLMLLEVANGRNTLGIYILILDAGEIVDLGEVEDPDPLL